MMPNYCKACTGQKKFAHYGLKGSGKKEWCATCAKEHGGVRLLKQQEAAGLGDHLYSRRISGHSADLAVTAHPSSLMFW